jgi:hypothetical protein
MDQRDLPLWGNRHGVRVQDRGDGLNAVDGAGTRADHDGICVDAPHRDAGQRRYHDRGLGYRAW